MNNKSALTRSNLWQCLYKRKSMAGHTEKEIRTIAREVLDVMAEAVDAGRPMRLRGIGSFNYKWVTRKAFFGDKGKLVSYRRSYWKAPQKSISKPLTQ